MPRTRFLLWLALSLYFLVGCNQLSRIGECKRFVRLANASTAELRALDGVNKIEPTREAYERLADRFEQFQKDIDALDVRDRELKQRLDDIKSTMTKSAEECRAYERELKALEKRKLSPKKKNAIQRDLRKIQTRMSQVVRGYRAQVAAVNNLCQPQH